MRLLALSRLPRRALESFFCDDERSRSSFSCDGSRALRLSEQFMGKMGTQRSFSGARAAPDANPPPEACYRHQGGRWRWRCYARLQSDSFCGGERSNSGALPLVLACLLVSRCDHHRLRRVFPRKRHSSPSAALSGAPSAVFIRKSSSANMFGALSEQRNWFRALPCCL